MNQHDEKLARILGKLGLTACQDCHTPITAENIGWNPEADYKDWHPIVYIACKKCVKRLKEVPVPDFARSLDDAIEKLNSAI